MHSSTRRHFLQLAGFACLLAFMPLSPAHAATASGLVDALTSQLGVSRPQAEGGAGALFGLAQQRMEPNQFSRMEEQVPGIGSLITAAPDDAQSGFGQRSGGGLGGLAGEALGTLGGQGGAADAVGGAAGGLGGLAPLAGAFSQLGLSPDMATRFLPVVLQYLNGSGAGSAAEMLQGALGR